MEMGLSPPKTHTVFGLIGVGVHKKMLTTQETQQCSFPQVGAPRSVLCLLFVS